MLNSEKTSVPSGSLFAILDERVTEGVRCGLSRLGFSVITLPRDSRLGEAVSSHTDMLLFRHGRNIIGSGCYFEKNAALGATLRSIGFNITESDASPARDYPHDAIFNALVIADMLFCKADTVCRDVVEYAQAQGLRVIGVKQGYPACTTLPLGEGAAITSDGGMARALMREGIDAILVEQSEKILLPPYKNGFIGGAAASLGKKIYFFGNIETLPYCDTLKKSADRLGLELISLDENADCLFDLGGAILCQGGF